MSDHYPLYQFSDEVLIAELERRKKVAKLPQPLDNPDFSGLKDMIIRDVEEQAANQNFDEDMPEYVYEAVIRTVYGQAYFDWRKAQGW